MELLTTQNPVQSLVCYCTQSRTNYNVTLVSFDIALEHKAYYSLPEKYTFFLLIQAQFQTPTTSQVKAKSLNFLYPSLRRFHPSPQTHKCHLSQTPYCWYLLDAAASTKMCQERHRQLPQGKSLTSQWRGVYHSTGIWLYCRSRLF